MANGVASASVEPSASSVEDERDVENPLCAKTRDATAHTNAKSTMPPVDARANRFPFCIVWSPLPGITWFLPFIGHMGIATSEGVMYDFAGPYTIGREHLAFGAPTRYLQLQVSPSDAAAWDESVARGCATYEKRMHNLCCDNCHSHVATCLEQFGYNGRTRWDMVTLCFWMFFCGRYVDAVAFLKSWLPFAVLVLVVCVVV